MNEDSYGMEETVESHYAIDLEEMENRAEHGTYYKAALTMYLENRHRLVSSLSEVQRTWLSKLEEDLQ